MELNLDNIKPVNFYGYAHSVTDRIVETQDKEEYEYYKKELIDFFNENGIKAINDNKIVFEVSINAYYKNEIHVFIGFYDWKMSVGFNVRKVY